MGLKRPGVQISVFCAGGCPHCEGAERERERERDRDCKKTLMLESLGPQSFSWFGNEWLAYGFGVKGLFF